MPGMGARSVIQSQDTKSRQGCGTNFDTFSITVVVSKWLVASTGMASSALWTPKPDICSNLSSSYSSGVCGWDKQYGLGEGLGGAGAGGGHCGVMIEQTSRFAWAWWCEPKLLL